MDKKPLKFKKLFNQKRFKHKYLVPKGCFMEPFLKDDIRHTNLWELLNFLQDRRLIPLIEPKKPYAHCSFERKQKVVAFLSSFKNQDSYCNEHVLVEEIM
jgi:hypothetical protein